MSDVGSIARNVADRQVTMFAMFVGQGMFVTRAALSRASGIPESTLREWAGGAAIPLHGVLTLNKFLPGEAIQMLTEHAGVRLVPVEAKESTWDEIAAEGALLTFEICEARKDGVIDHREDASLRSRARRVVASLTDLIGREQ